MKIGAISLQEKKRVLSSFLDKFNLPESINIIINALANYKRLYLLGKY